MLIDERVTLCDSTVICEYLEDRHPSRRFYPRDVADRARARWLEEFADTRMGEVFIWRLFNQVAINPLVWGVPTDEAVLEHDARSRHAARARLPRVAAARDGLPVRRARRSPTSRSRAFFRNAAFARYRVDAARWPRTAAFVERVLGARGFHEARAVREGLDERRRRRSSARRWRPPARRSARETYGTDAPPRRGIMSI